ncbi:uncharacterized protein LOC113869564 isoform X2 [Abrus precatorius]|uniref:Uncharacterized protein LOC113869564 isoform X2 n=1 Tax=Abrus precatorius TaxID=3816 RepID=A0A8B8M3H5_ABRPR|nr:uncharacterized protein LOC113869564 isoform X2 [Abrus precatorius]
MDPPDSHSQAQESPKSNGVVLVTLRWVFAILFPFLFFLSIPFLFGLLVLIVADFSISNPISLPSQCKIVSSGVDIRSSKICELGLLNYKAKDVFHHFERSKFRCRYDYYWASIFKVEYKDHFSGQTQVAFAEAPNEALPLYCRPNFGAAWLTQYRFKVNETYDCWYTSGISKVRLHQDSLFGCHANKPSTLEKSRQYSTLAMEMVNFWFSSEGRTRYWRWETIAGLVTGFLTSLIFILFIRSLQLLLCSLYRSSTTWKFPWRLNTVLISRACFLLAYLSFVAWLAIEYGKRLGLIDIFRFPKS